MSFLAEYDILPDGLKAPFFLKRVTEKPDEVFAELRAKRPILLTPPSPFGPPLAVVSRFRDVEEALAQWTVFTVRPYAARMDPSVGPFMLGRDDTALNEREKSIMLAMLPREDLPMVRQLAATLAGAALAPVLSKHSCDVVSVLGRPVPIRMVARYFGFPGPDEETMAKWSRATQADMFHNLLNDPHVHAACVTAGAQMRGYLQTLFAERRTASDLDESNDVISRLLRTLLPREIGWNEERFFSNAMGLLVGAVETSNAAIVQALDQLLDRPDALRAAVGAALADDDNTLDALVWEALRFFPVNPFVGRACVRDYVIAAGTGHAATIPAGSLAVIGTRSAMQDADVLPDPLTIRLDRPAWAYMHLGSGPHTCLGKGVALMMVPAVIKQLLKLPKLRRAGGHAGKLDLKGGPFPESMTVAFG
jgi:cytochrome P450